MPLPVQNIATAEKILRLASVKDRTGISRSMIYLLMSKGQFPNKVSLGARAVGWYESEVSAWIEGRANLSPEA